MDRFRSCLENLSWRNVLNSNDVDDSYNLFWNDFRMLFDQNFPAKKVKINELLVNGEQITDPIVMANSINAFFANAGKKIADSLPDSPIPLKTTLFQTTQITWILEQ